MKILSLAGVNLASLTTPFTIDFTQGALGSSGLFAITGNTGAGKSTLLDAICLALYDAMPRFLANRQNVAEVGRADEEHKLKANDVRTILSRGHANGFAEVRFRATDGRLWLARWEVRRARNRSEGRFQAQERTLTDLQSGQQFSGNKRDLQLRIDELIGLTWEQFRRAVILPQGEFASFLKADANERSALLERMTGSELYTAISMRSYERAKEEQQKLATIMERLGDVAPIDDATRELWALQQHNLTTELKHQQQQRQLMADLQELNSRITLQLHECEEAKESYQLAQEAYGQATILREEIALTEQAQVARADHDELARLTQLLTEQEARLVMLIQESELLEQQWQQGELQQQQLQREQAALTQEWGDLQSEIKQAQELDILLKEQRLVLQRLKEEEVQEQSRHAALQQQWLQKEQENSAMIAQQQQLHRWLDEQRQLLPLAHQWQPLLNAMQDWTQDADVLLPLERELDAKERSLEVLQQQQVINQKNRYDAGVELEQWHQQLQQLEEQQWESHHHKIQHQWQQQTEQLSHLSQLLALAESGRHHSEQFHHVTQETAALEQAFNRVAQVEQELEPTVARLTLQRDEAYYAVEQAKAVADVEQYRHLLIDGSACPLCGATEHPYGQHHPLVSTMLSQLTTRAAALDHQLQQSSQHSLQVKSERHELARQLAGRTEQLPQWIARQDELRRNWRELGGERVALHLPSSTLLTSERHDPPWAILCTALMEQRKRVEQTLTDSRQQLSHAESALQRLSSLRQIVVQATTHIQQQEQLWQQSERHFTTLQSEIIAINEQARVLRLRLDLGAKRLDEQMAGEPWRHYVEQRDWQQWQQRCEQFLAGQRQQERLASALASLAPEFSALESRLAAQHEGLQKQIRQIKEHEQQHQALLAQRDVCLGGESVAAFEQRWQQRLQQGAAYITEVMGKHAHVRELLTELNTKLSHIDEEKQVTRRRQREVLGLWGSRAAALGVTESELRRLLQITPMALKAQRLALQQVDENVTKATMRLGERQRVLAQTTFKRDRYQQHHPQLVALAANELAEQITQLNEHISHLEEQLFAYKTKLAHDEAASIKAIAIQQEFAAQQVISDQWQQLSDLIGQANGAKFRTFAQSLTLERLLLEANAQLRELSPRYQLARVPGSDLALQVVDLDMGDEVRSVESLSGGESFLVSLALALALSSLTSKQTQIESLFIDEGFGTLDPDSLDVALATLDSLQATGRQIGVISHVETLVERIGVQIRIETLGGGESHVILP